MLFDFVKNLFFSPKEKSEEIPQEHLVSDSAGEKDFPDVAPIEDIKYNKED